MYEPLTVSWYMEGFNDCSLTAFGVGLKKTSSSSPFHVCLYFQSTCSVLTSLNINNDNGNDDKCIQNYLSFQLELTRYGYGACMCVCGGGVFFFVRQFKILENIGYSSEIIFFLRNQHTFSNKLFGVHTKKTCEFLCGHLFDSGLTAALQCLSIPHRFQWGIYIGP